MCPKHKPATVFACTSAGMVTVRFCTECKTIFEVNDLHCEVMPN